MATENSDRVQLGFEVFIHDDLQGAKKLGVLRGEVEIRVGIALGVDLRAMDNIDFIALVEANRDLQNQEEVVAGGANTCHDIRNLVGFGKGFVDGVSQFLNQSFEIIVEIQMLTRKVEADLQT